MKKRLYLALLVTLTTAFVLTGCNGCNTETVEETTESITSEEVVEETETSEVEETTEDVAEPTTEETAETDTSEEVVEETETSEEVAETPAYTVTDMEKTMYAQRSVNVRSGPTTDYEKLGALNTNDEVKVTGQSDNGWYRIEYNGNTGFVSNNYLGDAKVVVNNTPATPTDNGTTTPTVDISNVPTRVVNGDTRYAFRTTANGTPIYDGTDWQWPQYIVDVINECCTPSMSDLEKATAIYNWMRANISYDWSYSSRTTNSTLSTRTAVCQGYANTYQSLCCAAGITGCVVNGFFQYNQAGHAWNYIYINGVKYFVDTTNGVAPLSNIISTTVENSDWLSVEVYDGGNKLTAKLYQSAECWDGLFDEL